MRFDGRHEVTGKRGEGVGFHYELRICTPEIGGLVGCELVRMRMGRENERMGKTEVWGSGAEGVFTGTLGKGRHGSKKALQMETNKILF